MPAHTILQTIGLRKSFGALVAVKDFTFEVKEKEIVGLIGPNGAGKTTLFNLICGTIKCDSGKIIFLGRNITNLPPHKICKAGIARVHQIPRPFLDLSVLENVIVGSLFGAGKNLSYARSRAIEILDFVGLEKKKDLPSRSLTAFEMKLLEIARTLAAEPKLLLLDEPFAGLNPSEIDRYKEIVKKIREEGITIILVEHIMKAIREVTDRVIVMHQGEKIAEGTFEEISKNEKVIEAYLGSKSIE